MGVFLVQLGDEILVDLRDITVTPETLAEGVVAIDCNGKKIVGTAKLAAKYKNRVPEAEDTTAKSIYGEDYNGDGKPDGYKDNARLSSTSGSVSGSAQNGSVVTGFIPFNETDVIRMKGAEWLNATAKYGGHFYFYLYNANKSKISDDCYATSEAYASNAGVRSQLSVTYDSATGVTTFKIIDPEGESGAFRAAAQSAAFFRINAYGKGANLIVTVNEEIV